jgi:hypothetical protein
LWFSDVDQELLQARSEIENAPIVKNDPQLYGPIYHNVSMFKRYYSIFPFINKEISSDYMKPTLDVY